MEKFIGRRELATEQSIPTVIEESISSIHKTTIQPPYDVQGYTRGGYREEENLTIIPANKKEDSYGVYRKVNLEEKGGGRFCD